jgi:hypothetical protein
MIEILGAELDQAFLDLGIVANKTYQIKNKNWEYCEDYQVWKLSDEDYEKLCNITEEEWKNKYGWWRGAKCSNMGNVNKRYNINNHYIWAWDGFKRNIKNYSWDRKYNNLLQYFCDEIGVSTETNVCSVAVDLAAQNNMTMAELFSEYQE